jgi:hypothetical protein
MRQLFSPRTATLLLVLLTGLWCGGCSRPPTTNYSLASGRQIPVRSITTVHFQNHTSALVMACETPISLDDKPALRKEADEIWATFHKDVEKAQVTGGVIRMYSSAGKSWFTQNKNYGFVFEHDLHGKWHCLQDDDK